VPFEVRHELAHRLLRDLRPPGELADARALGIQVRKDVAVRRAHVRMASRGDAAVELLRAEPEGLPEKEAEIVTRFTHDRQEACL
jgi:hypothetical protein